MTATPPLLCLIRLRYALVTLGLFGLLVFAPKTLTQAAGTTYYVDPAGDNGNSGTSESSPWKDFARVNSMTLQPGDRVLLRRGREWDQTLTINGKGTQGAFIEIGAYGTGARPKICGSSPMNSGTGFIAFRAMRINNPSYLKVGSLEVCNGGAGIVVYYDDAESGNRSVYFDDIVAHDFYGISQGSGEANVNHQYYCRDAGAKYVDLDREYFPKANWRDYRSPDYVAFSFGIGITGDPRPTSDRVLTDIRVTNSEIYRTGGGIAIDWDDGHNGHVNTVAEFLIDHVYLHDNDVPAVSLASIFFKNCTDCRITNTIIDRGICTAPYGTSAVFLGGQMRLVMDNVTIKDSPWDPSMGDSIGIDFEGYNLNVTIRNGWFENNAGGAIQFYNNGGPATDFLIEDNVFVENAAGEAREWGGDGAAQIDVSNWPSGGGHRGTIRDNWYVNWCGDNNWGEPVCTSFYRADSGNGVILSNNQEGLPTATPAPSPTSSPTPIPTPARTPSPFPTIELTPTITPIFADVPVDHPYRAEIEILYRAGYTAGCNVDPLMYCPEQTMNRAESAVFVERGIHTASYLPPPPTSQVFADLGLDSWGAGWVNGLWEDGYTAGCGTNPLVYCPWQGHTRAEGSVFYLRMLNGAEYTPLAPTSQLFVDVPLGTWYAGWVHAAYGAGLIGPCQTTPELRFCPDAALTRAIAAHMMVKAKGLGNPPPAVASCLSQTGPLITLEGTTNQRFDERQLAEDTKVDAAKAHFLDAGDYPIVMRGGGNLCFSGGFVEGTYPATTSWDAMHSTTAMEISNEAFTVEFTRIHNYGDGISVKPGANFFTVRGVHFSYIRDDCIENDWLYGGLVEDVLLDGCYSAFSARPEASGVDGRQNVLTIRNSLIRLQPMEAVYKDRGLIPGHDGWFKWDTSPGDLSPMLSLHDNILRVDQPANNVGLGIPEGKLASCSNNTVVWLGQETYGEYPAELPDCFTITTDRGVWDQAVAAWLLRHPPQGGSGTE